MSGAAGGSDQNKLPEGPEANKGADDDVIMKDADKMEDPDKLDSRVLAIIKAAGLGKSKPGQNKLGLWGGKRTDCPYQEFRTRLLITAAQQGSSVEDMGLLLLMSLTGNAFTFATTEFPKILEHPPVYPSFAELDSKLANKGFIGVVNDDTVTRDLIELRMKRDSSGNWQYTQHASAFNRLIQQRKQKMDDATARCMYKRSLPAGLQARVQTDPSGQEWTSLSALQTYTLAIVDAWITETSANKGDAAADSAAGAPKKKVKFAGKQAGGTPPDHKAKPSYVAGRKPEELNKLRKEGKCFKCGQKGHKAAACTASK